MSRSRDYIDGVPAEVAERIYNIRKRRKLSRSEEPMETPLKAPTPYFSKPATPGRRAHPPGFRSGSAKRSTKKR